MCNFGHKRILSYWGITKGIKCNTNVSLETEHEENQGQEDIKHPNPPESLDFDDPLVKWVVDCVQIDTYESQSKAPSSASTDLSKVQVAQDVLKRELKAAKSQIR